LSLSITSFALATNATWPFVTFDDFEARVDNLRKVLKTDLIGLSPLVKRSDRVDWEKYSIAQQGWIDQAWAQNEYLRVERATVYRNDQGTDEEAELEEEQVARAPIFPKIFRLDRESYESENDKESDETGEIEGFVDGNDRRKLESNSEDVGNLNRLVAGDYDKHAPLWQV
jgi:hypothetical protein